jgi:hypothetical protein
MSLSLLLLLESGFDFLIFLRRRKGHKRRNVAASAEVNLVIPHNAATSAIALDRGAADWTHAHLSQRRRFLPGASGGLGFGSSTAHDGAAAQSQHQTKSPDFHMFASLT